MASTCNDFLFKPGQVVTKAQPLIYAMKSEYSGSYCYGCFRSPKEECFKDRIHPLEVCRQCRHFKYCSDMCKLDDWNNFHGLGECEIYAKHGQKLKDDDFGRFALRAVLLHLHRPKKLRKRVKMVDGTKRSFNDLMDHIEEIQQDAESMDSFMKVISLLKSLDLEIDDEKVLKILAKLWINCLWIQNTMLHRIGYGLYLEAAIFDHSCQPSAGCVFNGLSMEVRTFKNISSPADILINYIGMEKVTVSRREDLKARWHFICQCARCVKYENNVGEELLICQTITQLKTHSNELVQRIRQNPDLYTEEDWKHCYTISLKMIPLFEFLSDGYFPGKSLHMMDALQMFIHSKCPDKSEIAPLLLKTFEAMKITHGTEHPRWGVLLNLAESIQFKSSATVANSQLPEKKVDSAPRRHVNKSN